MMQPLISIIVPCYNSGCFVGEAIESCLSQSYRNLEVIVVEDGSTDDSPRVIREYRKRKPEIIRVLTQNRAGSSAARNRGLTVSRGDYLLFLDADDLLTPDSIDCLVGGLRDQRVDSMVGDWINFDEEHPDSGELVSSEFAFPEDPLASLIEKPMVISSIMVVRNPRKWNEQFVVNEVFDYFFGLFATGLTVGRVDRPVTKIRQHRSASRLTVAHDHFDPVERTHLFVRYKRLLKKQNMLTDRRAAALDRKILGYLYAALRRGIRPSQEYCAELDVSRFRSYHWFKTFGAAGFSRVFGPSFGLRLFYSVNRLLGRA